MTNGRYDVLVLFGAFVSGAILSFVHNPMLGVAALIGTLTIWSGMKRVPELKKVKIDKSLN